MQDVFYYAGYYGSKDWSDSDKVWHGYICNTTDNVTYESIKEEKLEEAFQEAVQDYVITLGRIEDNKKTPLKKMIENYTTIWNRQNSDKKILTEMLKPQIVDWLKEEDFDLEDPELDWYLTHVNEQKIFIKVFDGYRCVFGTEFEIDIKGV